MTRRIPRSALLAALAAAAAFALYVPALSFGWVNWDDGLLVVDNPWIRGLNAGLLRGAFTAAPGGAYQPLAFLSYALDYRAWGLDARGYHLTNALLHALCAALCFLSARRLLLLARPRADGEPAWAADAAALFAALAFALHPLRVESVAWISERRDPLCAAFWLAAVVAYLRAREPGKRKGTLLAVEALFAAACLAKATAVTLPLVLLVIDVFLLRRPFRESAVEKTPMLALGGALGVWAVARQAGARASWSLANHGLAARAAQAAYALAFYVRESVWPAGLSPFYELRPPLDPLEPRFLLSAACVAGAAVLLWRERSRRPFLAAAGAAYAIVLLPVSGVAQAGAQLVADRYSYLAALPLAVLAGAGLRAALRRKAARPLALAGAAAAIGALVAAAAVQRSYWRDSESLWRRALAVDPASPTAWLNLGNVLAGAGRVPEAAGAFERALAGDPACASAAGDPAVLETRPVCRKALNNLGAARAQLGDYVEARRLLLQAVSADPDDGGARRNLARVEAALSRGKSP